MKKCSLCRLLRSVGLLLGLAACSSGSSSGGPGDGAFDVRGTGGVPPGGGGSGALGGMIGSGGGGTQGAGGKTGAGDANVNDVPSTGGTTSTGGAPVIDGPPGTGGVPGDALAGTGGGIPIDALAGTGGLRTDAGVTEDGGGTGGVVADAPAGGNGGGGVGGAFLDAGADAANGGQAGTDASGATGGTGGSNCGAPGGPTDPCDEAVCTQPPADACIDGTTLRHYDADGMCVRGACKYAYRDLACSGGCAAGVCQGELCGATACTTPAAATCTGSTLTVPAPAGTCSSNVCSYASQTVTCSVACLGAGCHAGDDLTENDVIDHPPLVPFAFVLDRGSQPHFAWCEAGRLRYKYRGAIGWQTIDVETDATLGTDCGVVLTLDASNRARLAYRNSTAKAVRFAEETAPGTFSIVTPVYNDGYGLALAALPSGEPVIAYVTGPAGGRYVSLVSRSGASWNIEIVAGPPTYAAVGQSTQMAIAADGTIHVLNGAAASNPYSGSVAPDAIYARRRGGTWDVRVVKTSIPASRGLVLDAQGNPTLLTRTSTAATSGSTVYEILWTFDTDGTTLVAERVSRHNDDGESVPPFLLTDAYGEVRVAYTVSVTTSSPSGITSSLGSAFHRLAWELWAPVVGQTNYADVQVGSDGVPRYMVPQGGSNQQHGLVRPTCRPVCGDHDCGPDGCGGLCGVCGSCATCGEDGHCNAVSSERITRVPGQPIPTTMPTASAAFLAGDGRIMVRDTNGTTAQLGTTGAWGQTTAVPASSTLLNGGGQLYAVQGAGGSVYRWDGTTWQTLASLAGLPSSLYAVDAGANLHLAYVEPGDTVYKPQRLMHITISSAGVIGQPEEVVSTGTTTTFATIGLTGLVGGGANVLHYTYKYGTRSSSSASFVYEYRHTVSGMGSWPQTPAPTGMQFGGGLVDTQGTLWIRMATTSTVYSKINSSGYATRKTNGQWSFPTISDTTFLTQKMPSTSALLFQSPGGGIYSSTTSTAGTSFYKLDVAADAWSQIAAGIGDLHGIYAFDAQGVLHGFGVQSPAGIDQLRHWWFTPP